MCVARRFDRCRARSLAGRLDEDRSIDDAAGLLNSADIILITVDSRISSNTLDLASDHELLITEDEDDVGATKLL